MKLVLIESPYAGNVALNVKYARACLRDSILRGEAPFASHLLYTQEGVLSDDVPSERALGIEAGLAWGRKAEITAVYVDLGVSEGMRKGIKRAIEEGRPREEREIGFQCIACEGKGERRVDRGDKDCDSERCSDCSGSGKLALYERWASVALVERCHLPRAHSPPHGLRVLSVWNRRYEGWTLPGGLVEESTLGETREEALARELREETGLEVHMSQLVFEGAHGQKPKNGSRGGRASKVALYRVAAHGEPRAMEPGCDVSWLTHAEFIEKTPFRSFYEPVFKKLGVLA